MPNSARFISAKYSAVTISSELKLEPKCPDPARLTVAKVLARHMSASSCNFIILSILAARMR